MALSKNKIKFIHSLERKKTRDGYGLFLAEGNKIVQEALQSGFKIESLICTDQFRESIPADISQETELILSDKASIKKASLLQAPQDAIAVIKKPSPQSNNFTGKLTLAIDFIQDPGNLGTILRIADWFGIETIVCSSNTVDVYNPKVVQASMGAIFRVKTIYTELKDFLAKEISAGTSVFGTFMEGANIYQQKLPSSGILVMGNEGKGISPEIEDQITSRLTIPSFADNGHGSESLNVAVATAICCSEFKRSETT